MVDRYNADIRPPGPDDANEHDGLDVALPLMIQQVPNYDALVLAPAINIMTQDPWSVNHHEAEAFIIGQFIQEEDDPIGKTKKKFEDNTDIVKEIEAVEQGKNEGHDAKFLVKKFGMACPMPGSFQSSLVSIIGAKSYYDAIRETIACGGDACSRANLIGACLGAKYGIEGIPIDWLAILMVLNLLLRKLSKSFKSQ
jgi:ADP-ribosylglycohydrolase